MYAPSHGGSHGEALAFMTTIVCPLHLNSFVPRPGDPVLGTPGDFTGLLSNRIHVTIYTISSRHPLAPGPARPGARSWWPARPGARSPRYPLVPVPAPGG